MFGHGDAVEILGLNLAKDLVFFHLIDDVLCSLALRVLDVVDPLELDEVSVDRIFNDVDVAVLAHDVGEFECAQSLTELHEDDVLVLNDLLVLRVVGFEPESSLPLHG